MWEPTSSKQPFLTFCVDGCLVPVHRMLRQKLWLRWSVSSARSCPAGSVRCTSAGIFAPINIYFPSYSSKIWPSVRFGLREIACLRVRQRRQRCGASSRRPGCGARSICRLCKVIQRVMTEEQATADSGFSRYVGHSEGALVCIFLLPCLFLCCLSSHNRLSAHFFRDVLLFSCFFGLLTGRGGLLR